MNYFNTNAKINNINEQLAQIATQVTSFGAIGNGTHDDTTAIQNAINSLTHGGTVYFPITSSFYLISNQITVPSNVKLISNGATIKSNVRIPKGYFTLNNVQNIHIEGFVFDMNMQNLSVYQASEYDNLYNEGIDLESVQNITIKGNQFINLYTQSIGIHNGSGLYVVENNIFHSPVQSQQSIINHIYNVTFNGHFIVINNAFDNDPYTNPANGVCGVMCDGVSGKTTISKNKFNYCGRNNSGGHRLGVIDFYGNESDVTISENTALNTCWHFIRLNGATQTIVTNNRVHIVIAADQPILEISCSDLSYNTRNITVTENIFESDVASVYGIGGNMTDYSKPFKNIHITNNTFKNIHIPILFTGIFDSLSIIGNIFDSCDQPVSLGLSTSATETGGVTQASSYIKGINISDNTANQGEGIQINFYGYTGTIEKPIKISGNNLTGSNSGSLLIVTNGFTPLITNNILKNGNIGLYLRNNVYGYVYENLLYNFTTPISAGDITNLSKANNFHNDVAV